MSEVESNLFIYLKSMFGCPKGACWRRDVILESLLALLFLLGVTGRSHDVTIVYGNNILIASGNK
jgi:hypothetical protein